MSQASDAVGVLIVDDEPRIRDGLTRVLTAMGYRIAATGRGEEVPSLLARENAAIVLLDLQLPDVNGMLVLNKIRERYPHVVVIIITGFGTVQTAAEAMRNGAYDLLPKPFEPEQLRIAIRRAHEKMILEREARRLQQEKLRTLADLSLEKSRTHTIIDALPIGVMVTNAGGDVVLFNPTFARYMALPAGLAEVSPLAAYIPDEALRRLVLEFSQGCHVGPDDSPTYEFSLGPDKFLFARGRPVLD
ncbi:MAG: response regulator, partial [Desulfatitalea sp.]|nr:response regulator [Desulfatitalea sp.]